MTVEPSYQRCTASGCQRNGKRHVRGSSGSMMTNVRCICENGFIPDPCLQAIVAAWNDRNEYQRADIYGYWPEFSDLLDALTEEN